MPLEPFRRGALAMCSRIRPFIASALLFAALTATQQARAELITFRFAGVVTGVYFSPDGQLALGDIDLPPIGTPFTGYYKFDSATTVLAENAVEVFVGEYHLAGQSIVISASTGRYGAADFIPSIVLISHPELAATLDNNNFQLSIDKAGLLPGTSLPLTPPSLVGVDSAFLRMSLDNKFNSIPQPYITIDASLDSLIRVPEPATVSGLALVFLFLGIRRPKRIKRCA